MSEPVQSIVDCRNQARQAQTMSDTEQENSHGFDSDTITPAVRRLNLLQNLSADQLSSDTDSPPPERSGPSRVVAQDNNHPPERNGPSTATARAGNHLPEGSEPAGAVSQTRMDRTIVEKAKSSIRGAMIEINTAKRVMQALRESITSGEVLSAVELESLVDEVNGRRDKIEKTIDTIVKEGILDPEDNVMLELYDLSAEMATLKIKAKRMLGQCTKETNQDKAKETSEIETKMPFYYHPPQQMEIPRFRGDADASRFHLWLNEWNDYVTECRLTESSQLRVLLSTAVKDAAKIQVSNANSAEEAIKILEFTYGHPKAVLGACVEDIDKLGNCPYKTSPQMRDWLLRVSNHLDQIDNLCKKDATIRDNLPNCDINHLIMNRLPYQVKDTLKKKLLKMYNGRTGLMYYEEFTAIKKFIKSHIEDVRMEVLMDMKYSGSSRRSKESKEAADKDVRDRNFKKSYHAAPKEHSESKPNAQTRPNKDKYASKRACKSCGKDHQYLFYCENFIKAKVQDRFQMVKAERSCIRCLRLGINYDHSNKDQWNQEHKRHCNTKFLCSEDRCKDKAFENRCHMLICGFHQEENVKTQASFISALDDKQLPSNVEKKDLSFFHIYYTSPCNKNSVTTLDPNGRKVLPDVEAPALFLLQEIEVKNKKLLVFYDSGCTGAAISDRACEILDVETVREGPTLLSVAGGKDIKLPHGDVRFFLHLMDQQHTATITALRMPKITSHFPKYELKQAYNDLMKEAKTSGLKSELPSTADYVGGQEVDIILGAKYIKYYPELIYKSSNLEGLGIYKAVVGTNPSKCGIITGPHYSWHEDRSTNCLVPKIFLTSTAESWRAQERWHQILEIDAPASGVFNEITTNSTCEKHNVDAVAVDYPMHSRKASIAQTSKEWNQVEELGTEISYRCLNCRECKDCKAGEQSEMMSIKEELEQFMIENSLSYREEEERVVAKLPFTGDPATKLLPNKGIAERVLAAQLRKIQKRPEMAEDIKKAHDKLKSRGYVKTFEDLSSTEKHIITNNNHAGHHIPWRTVYKEGSLSTPCRMVFDASAKTPGGASLNSILAKGQNKLVKLYDLLLRFKSNKFGLAADISMCYNGTKLHEQDLCWQKYLWREPLTPAGQLTEMFITTIIYGVTSSGNQSQAALCLLADKYEEKRNMPSIASTIIRKDTYVDDIVTSLPDMDQLSIARKELEEIMAGGSMKLKGFSISGSNSDDNVSPDGVTTGLCGYIWKPKQDMVSINTAGISEIMPPRQESNKKSQAITRRVAAGIAARIFDPLGLASPFTARVKMNLHSLCRLKLDWDDAIPQEYIPSWIELTREVEELKEIEFQRSIMPEDAVDNNISLLISTDASENIAAACVHARIMRKNGEYSCQLLTAKTSIVNGATIPRAELKAMVMGATLCHLTQKNFGDRVTETILVTDSAIGLFWINQDNRPLKLGVRNSVIEIRRLTKLEEWHHVCSEDNIADICTRGTRLEAISTDSEWQQGKPWMKLPKEDMPLRSPDKLILDQETSKIASKELKTGIHVMSHQQEKKTPYPLDTQKFGWKKFKRITALCLKFIRMSRKQLTPGSPITKIYTLENNCIQLLESDIQEAEKAIFRTATAEVRSSMKSKDIESCSFEKEGILYYDSRIQDCMEIEEIGGFVDVNTLSFVKPLVAADSPLAKLILSYVHWHEVNHYGVPAMIRKSREIAYIFGAKKIAEDIKHSCTLCKRLQKKLVSVQAGKTHPYKLTIAPAFYRCQVDLFGPLTAWCEHNHRSTVKVWGVVFKDPSSCAVWVEVMQGYDTSSFVMSYTRFACRFGHPAKLLPDEGSQLMSACKDMKISWIDINTELSGQFGVNVEFQHCPVGGHNEHGAVERSIKEIKRIFEVLFTGRKMSITGYSTAFAIIANELNNLPICLGSKYDQLGHMDIITPARLIYGRANKRAFTGICEYSKPSKALEQVDITYKTWWTLWEKEKIADLIPKSKQWKSSKQQIRVNDIVLFPKEGSEQVIGKPVWRIGRVTDVEESTRDNLVRRVKIEYKNQNENVFRTTRRSARQIAILHNEDDIHLMSIMTKEAANTSRAYYQDY